MKPVAIGREHTVYILRDPFDRQIRYVGVTCQPLRDRLKGHVYEVSQLSILMEESPPKEFHNSTKQQWIAKLRRANCWPIIEPIEICSTKRARDLERSYVHFFTHVGCNLVNAEASSIKRIETSGYYMSDNEWQEKIREIGKELNQRFAAGWKGL